MGRDVGAANLFFEIAVNVYALVDACTHECTAHDTVYDGALEAEPRLLQQTRNFLLSQPASTNQTFQACGVRRCDACAASGGIIGAPVTKSVQSDPISDALIAHILKVPVSGGW
jgi:hypothetical protein